MEEGELQLQLQREEETRFRDNKGNETNNNYLKKQTGGKSERQQQHSDW